MEYEEGTCSAGTVALAIVGGAIAGVVAGILLAPKSGGDTRRVLKGYAGRAEEEVLERAKEARADLEEMIERGKRFMSEKAADVEAAVKSGRAAVTDTLEKCRR